MSEPWKPHAGQKKGVKFFLEHHAAALLADPGVGKTSITYAAFSMLKKRKIANRMLVIAPLRPCQMVWPAERDKWQDFNHLSVEVLHGPGKDAALARGSDVCVINPEGLDWLLDAKRTTSPSGKLSVTTDLKAFKALGFDTLVLDECFPAGVNITMADGTLRPIESVREGDLVVTDVGSKSVSRVFVKSSNDLIYLVVSNGKKIPVTKNHPFFTDKGWLPAKYCVGRRIFNDFEMSLLWKSFSSKNKISSVEVLGKENCSRLLEILRATSLPQEQPGENSCCINESTQRHYRQTLLEQGNINADSFAGGIYFELRDIIGEEAARLSYVLQSGLRRPDTENSGRGGWREPLWKKGSGPEERQQVDGTWVDSIENYKSNCKQNVWNIQVEDAARFYANGYLVHNCTMWKNINSGRHKALRQIVSTFARRWGLTGTPAPNGLIDLFGQCYVLDMGRTFGPYVTHFRREFFVPSYDGFSWTLQKGAEERIYERIKPLALRLAAEDYVDMPEMVENVIKFDLPPSVRKVYTELEDDMIAKLGDQVVTAVTAAALSTKCRQIASGGLYVEDAAGTSLATQVRRAKGREWFDLHDIKTELVADLLDELQGTPLLVAYQFQHDLARLQRKFGADVPFIGGGTTQKKAVAIEAAWNRGELPLLIGHPQSIGHGLNLQNAGNHVCWYSLPNWNLELYDQFNRRVRRQGSKHSRVFVHHLIATDTVDEIQMYSLRHKAKAQTALFDALRTKRRR